MSSIVYKNIASSFSIYNFLKDKVDIELPRYLTHPNQIEKNRNEFTDYDVCFRIQDSIFLDVKKEYPRKKTLKCNYKNIDQYILTKNYNYKEYAYSFYEKKGNWDSNKTIITPENISSMLQLEENGSFCRRYNVDSIGDNNYVIITYIKLFKQATEKYGYDDDVSDVYSVINNIFYEEMRYHLGELLNLLSQDKSKNIYILPPPNDLNDIFDLHEILEEQNSQDYNEYDILKELGEEEMRNMDLQDPTWRIANDFD